jgi:predicted nucleic acid-binding protein
LTIYLDSSLIVSLHCIDANSKPAANAFLLATKAPVITQLCQLEVINALNLRVFRKEISRQEALLSIRSFEEDTLAGAYDLKPLPENVMSRALHLSQQTTQQIGTRSADILHVASALELGADSFFSFDTRQRQLAAAVGLNLNSI